MNVGPSLSGILLDALQPMVLKHLGQERLKLRHKTAMTYANYLLTLPLLLLLFLPPCAGLFLGAFGPHGPEVIQVQRSVCLDTGAEQVRQMMTL